MTATKELSAQEKRTAPTYVIVKGSISDVFSAGLKVYWGSCKLTYYNLSFGKDRSDNIKRTETYLKSVKDTPSGTHGMVAGIVAYWATSGIILAGSAYGVHELYSLLR